MSYLVDALKKAEQERHARHEGDLRAAATMTPGTRPGFAPVWRWLVAVLVAINVGLVIYVWRPQPARTGAANQAETAMTSGPSATYGSGSRQRMASAQAALQAGRPLPGTGSGAGEMPAAGTAFESRPTRSADTSTSTAEPARTSRPPADDASATAPASSRRHHGSVVYSRVPLTDGPTGDSSDAAAGDAGQGAPSSHAASAATTNADVGSGASAGANPDSLPVQSDLSVPQIQINGQLFSTQPGRSFILVDGRRYHEGERIEAGPAIETIEPNGAVLNYQGQRYRVRGPGGD